MVSLISDAKYLREIGTAQERPQHSPASPSNPDPHTQLPADKRVMALQATVDRLVRSSLPSDAKLQIDQDEDSGVFIYKSINRDTGEVIAQWPPESLLELRKALRELDGMLVDKTV
jgi:flagellar protein FlaG